MVFDKSVCKNKIKKKVEKLENKKICWNMCIITLFG